MNIAIAPTYTQRDHTWTSFKSANLKKIFSIQFAEDSLEYKIWGYDGPEVHVCTLYKTSVPDFVTSITQEQNDLDRADFEANFKLKANDKINTRVIEKLPDPQPFAVPTHRAKINCIAAVVACAPGETVNLDFYMAAERFITGGELIVENGRIGDHFKAEVRDDAGIIPEPYRAVLCENWPVVATYIERSYLKVTSTLSVHEIDTSPLTAKINAGLHLSLTFTAIETGEARNLALNYRLTKKL